MAETEPRQHRSWLLIIVIPLVIIALILVFVLGLRNKNRHGTGALIEPPGYYPMVSTHYPTPTLGQDDQIETIEKGLEATIVDDLESELDQMENIFNQL